MMFSMNKQHGSTLLVALIMLVLMMLIAVSAMNASSISVQMTGNAQFKEEASAAGQREIETMISTGGFQNIVDGTARTVDINQDGVMDYTVTFTPAPTCVSYKPVAPDEPNIPKVCIGSTGALCYWTIWDVTAQVADNNGSGATVTIHQGIKTIAGLNAALTSCGI